MAPSWWKSVTGGGSGVAASGKQVSKSGSEESGSPQAAGDQNKITGSSDAPISDPQTPDTQAPLADAELIDKTAAENAAAVTKLRALHSPLLESYERRTYDDEWWIRFLRARDLSIDEAVKMIKEDINWRLTNNVDSILNTNLSYAPFVRQYYPHGYHGVDRQGRPIYIDCIGRADATAILKEVTLDDMMNVYIQEYEQLVDVIFPCCTEAAGHKVNRTTTIVDLQGLGWSHVNNNTRAILKRLSYVSQNHYPEILGQMFIVNAPPIFSGVWTFIRRLIDETTVTKINISSTRSVSWKTRLAEYIDPDQLPDFLGGNVKWENHEWTSSCFGPWTDPTVRAASLDPAVTALSFPQSAKPFTSAETVDRGSEFGSAMDIGAADAVEAAADEQLPSPLSAAPPRTTAADDLECSASPQQADLAASAPPVVATTAAVEGVPFATASVTKTPDQAPAATTPEPAAAATIAQDQTDAIKPSEEDAATTTPVPADASTKTPEPAAAAATNMSEPAAAIKTPEQPAATTTPEPAAAAAKAPEPAAANATKTPDQAAAAVTKTPEPAAAAAAKTPSPAAAVTKASEPAAAATKASEPAAAAAAQTPEPAAATKTAEPAAATKTPEQAAAAAVTKTAEPAAAATKTPQPAATTKTPGPTTATTTPEVPTTDSAMTPDQATAAAAKTTDQAAAETLEPAASNN